MTSIGANIHHRSSQNMMTIRNFTKLYGMIIPSIVSWRQLSTFSRSVPCILQSETCWEKAFEDLGPRILLGTRKSLGAVVKFFDSLIQLLCWWLAWFEQLESLLGIKLWHRPAGCHVSLVSVNICIYSWGIRRHRTPELIIHAATATLPISYRQMFLNFISSWYSILLYNFCLELFNVRALNWSFIYKTTSFCF